ncbi:hypothetical protein NW768_008584 [Fusarium equiseti]|uniref:Ankyrin n=1 Tax=Fusarium equiseti TaxID=61235 RepID=A0ABQ8R4R2_FUSEQ|nr:hypothetical protein NW768_008584 [Fusarium equiseti]
MPIQKMEIVATDDDISAYVDGWLSNTPRLKDLTTPVLIGNMKKTIIDKARGMFLTAELLMGILTAATSRRDRSDVEESLKTLPSFGDDKNTVDYHGAYQSILKNIWAQPSGDVDLAREVMSWIIFGKNLENLSFSVVKAALMIERGRFSFASNYCSVSKESILSVCRGLVKVDEATGTVRFAHYTTAAYFANDTVQSQSFNGYERYLARVCLKCISLAREAHHNHSRNHALYQYACRYWGHHARAAEDSLAAEIDELLTHTNIMSRSFQLIADELPRHWKPEYSGSSRFTPIHVASYYGLTATATSLLTNGHDVESADHYGWTPIRWAVIGGSEEMVHLLLKHQASIVSTDIAQEQTAFWILGSRVSQRRCDTMRISGPATCIIGDCRFMSPGLSFSTALPEPVVPKTSQEVLQIVLENLPTVDARRNTDNRTLLSVASENWLWTTIQSLLDLGADVNSKDTMKQTPLLWALQPPRLKSFYSNVCVDDVSRLSIGSVMIHRGPLQLNVDDHSITEKLIEPTICRLIGADIEAKDGEGRTALSLAAENRFHQVLKCLLDQGADPNTSDMTGMTPLHYACSLPRFETVQIDNLQCSGKASVRLGSFRSPQMSKPQALTPLVAPPPERSVRLLLQRGALKSAKSRNGLTALSLAKLDGLESMARFLAEDTVAQERNVASQLDNARNGAPQHHSRDILIRNTQSIETSDYVKLLLAMLERRPRFQITSVQITDKSMLLASATSDILNLTVAGLSQVLISEQVYIAQLKTIDAPVVIANAALSIDCLFLSDRSSVILRNDTQISYMIGEDGSTLWINGDFRVRDLTIQDTFSLRTRGRSIIDAVQGFDRSSMTIDSKAKISEITLNDRCSIEAKSGSELGQVNGFGESRLKLTGNNTIYHLTANDKCTVEATGNTKLNSLQGFDKSKLSLVGSSILSEICVDYDCLVEIKGSCKIGRSGMSIVIGDVEREDEGGNGHSDDSVQEEDNPLESEYEEDSCFEIEGKDWTWVEDTIVEAKLNERSIILSDLQT